MSKSVSRMRISPVGAVAALVLPFLLSVFCERLPAAPLDAEECRKLSVEHKEMVGTGIEAKLVKGPLWGLANLTTEELDSIKHFLSVEEQLQFRCPLIQASEPQALNGMPLPTRRPELPASSGKSAGIEASSTQSN